MDANPQHLHVVGCGIVVEAQGSQGSGSARLEHLDQTMLVAMGEAAVLHLDHASIEEDQLICTLVGCVVGARD